MNLDIRLARPSAEASAWLGEVADSLESDGHALQRHGLGKQATRSPLTEWVSVGLSTAGLVITVLQYLRSRRPKSKITVTFGSRTAQFDRADQEEIARLRQWAEAPGAADRSLTVEVED